MGQSEHSSPFAPDYVKPGNAESKDNTIRNAIIVRTSIIGIVVNVVLASVKAVIGLFVNSIAIVLDAVNNSSDVLSSVITIIGVKLAGKEPDRTHPYGHGRTEYISAITIGFIILLAGLASLRESIIKIINPETASYDVLSLVIIGSTVAVKILLGRYFIAKGKKVTSDSLVASGADALLDAAIAASTLVAALIFIFTGISLEAWLGLVIALVIIRAAIEILREATSKILGQRVDSDLMEQIKTTICSAPGVHDAYDLLITDFGPERLWGSVHVEVDATMTAAEIDKLARQVSADVYANHNVIIHTVGIYAVNVKGSGDIDIQAIRREIAQIVWSHEYIVDMHGFYLDEVERSISLDLTIGFDAPDREGEYRHICNEIQEAFPDYSLRVTLDLDMSD